MEVGSGGCDICFPSCLLQCSLLSSTHQICLSYTADMSPGLTGDDSTSSKYMGGLHGKCMNT